MSKVIPRAARRVALLGLLAVLPLVLTGCFRVDLAISVNEDGSGTMNMLVAFDQSLLELIQGAGGSAGSDDGSATTDPLDLLGGLETADLPEGVTVEPYDEDGFVGARVTYPFAATDDVAASLDETFAATGEASPFGGDGSASPLEGMVLRKEDDGGWRFEAGTSSLSGGGDAEALPAGMGALLLGNATFTVRLRLPGEVVETNADEQKADGELIWNIDPAGDDRTLLARTKPGGGGSNALLIVGAVIATALVVGGIGYYLRRRATEPSTGEPPAGGAPTGAPPSGGPPAAQPPTPEPPAATGGGE